MMQRWTGMRRATALLGVMGLWACQDVIEPPGENPAPIEGVMCAEMDAPAGNQIIAGVSSHEPAPDIRITPAPGGGALVAWTDYFEGVGMVRLVGPDGQPDGVEIAITHDDAYLTAPPQVVVTDTGFAASYQTDNQAWLVRLDARGAPTAPSIQVSPAEHVLLGTTSVAHLGDDRLMVAWADANEFAAFMQLVDADDLPGPMQRVSPLEVVFQPVSVAATPGGNAVVLWVDDLVGVMRFQRFDTLGAPLGGPVDVGEAFESGDVAINDAGEIAVALAETVALVRFFDADGVPLGPELWASSDFDGPGRNAMANDYSAWRSVIDINFAGDDRVVLAWPRTHFGDPSIRYVETSGVMAPLHALPHEPHAWTYVSAAWLPCIDRTLVAWIDGDDWTLRFAIHDQNAAP